MGYKIIPHTFRDDSSVSAERVLENMRAIASEVNGNLDRENIPKDGITTAMIKPEAFNTIVHNTESTTNSIVAGGWQEVDASNMSINIHSNEDVVLVVNWGCTYEWVASSVGLAALLDDDYGSGAGVILKAWWDADEMPTEESTVFEDSYSQLLEIYCDFELRANGHVFAKSEFNSVFRKKHSPSMVGAINVPAGEINISVHARLRRVVGIQVSDVDAFTLNIGSRSIVAEIKRR